MCLAWVQSLVQHTVPEAPVGGITKQSQEEALITAGLWYLNKLKQNNSLMMLTDMSFMKLKFNKVRKYEEKFRNSPNRINYRISNYTKKIRLNSRLKEAKN